MSRTTARAIAIATSCAIALSACGSGDGKDGSTDGAGKITVGVAMPTSLNDRWAIDGKNLVSEFAAFGYDTDLQSGEDDIAKQVSQIDAMIEKKCKLLIIGSIDGTKLTASLAKAKQRHIPVIAYDRLIRDSPDVDYYATFDNFMVGVLQGSAIETRLGLAKGLGPFTIELFAGSPDDNNATVFFNGAMAILKPYVEAGRLVVRSGQRAFEQVSTMRWDPETARTRMASLLASYYRGTNLDAVLSANDGIARGVVSALQFGGYGTPARPLPIVTGQDAELDSVRQIISGTQTMTIYKDTRLLAKAAAAMGRDVINRQQPTINDLKSYNNGKKIVPTYLLDPVAVDQTNYQRILVDSGQFSAAQLGK